VLLLSLYPSEIVQRALVHSIKAASPQSAMSLGCTL